MTQLEIAKEELEGLVEQLQRSLNEVENEPLVGDQVSSYACQKLDKTLQDVKYLKQQINEQETENQMLQKECGLMKRKMLQMQEDHNRLIDSHISKVLFCVLKITRS